MFLYLSYEFRANLVHISIKVSEHFCHGTLNGTNAWILIRGSWFWIIDAWCFVLDAWFVLVRTHPIPSILCTYAYLCTYCVAPQMGAMHSHRRQEVSPYFCVGSRLLHDPISRLIDPPHCLNSVWGKSAKSTRDSRRWEPQQEPPCYDANARTIVILRDQSCSWNVLSCFPPQAFVVPEQGSKVKSFLGSCWEEMQALNSPLWTINKLDTHICFTSLHLQHSIIILPGLCLECQDLHSRGRSIISFPCRKVMWVNGDLQKGCPFDIITTSSISRDEG